MGDVAASTPADRLVQVVAAIGIEFTTAQLPDDQSLPPTVDQLVSSLRAVLPGISIPPAVTLAGKPAVEEALPVLRSASVLVGVPCGGMAQEIFAALAMVGRPVVLLAGPLNMQQIAGGMASLRADGLGAHAVFSVAEAVGAVGALLRDGARSAPAAITQMAGKAAPIEPTERGSGGSPGSVPTVLLIGGTSPSVVDSDRDPGAFAARTGTRLVQLAWSEVLYELDQLPADAVDKAAAEWKAGATAVEVNDALLRRSAGLLVVLERLLDRHHAAALAADCVGGIVQGRLTPCLAFSRLEDKGIVVGCEGDLCTLQARLLLRAITGSPGFTGNLGPVDREGGTITIWHHTVPLSFLGSPLPYAVRPYGRKDGGYGAFTMVTFPEGTPVTLLRLDKKARRATVATGKIVDGTPPPGRNHSRMVIQIASASRFMEFLLGNHHAVVPGDWADSVVARLKASGVLVTRI